MYQKVAPMLLVEDVDKTEEWYRNVLGAELQYSMPQNPPFMWVSLLLDDVEIMFGQRGEATKWYSDSVTVVEKPSNFIVYFYINNLDQLYDHIRDEVEIVMEPMDQSYGIREFVVRDPFGFILVFAEILE